MKITIFGGSFNPIHFGHIHLAQWVLEHTDTDALWLMVSPNNPLKAQSVLADEQVRLAGVQAALAPISTTKGKQLVASDFEFTLPRPSYTANTLRALQKAYPKDTFQLLIGEDNWRIFTRWREWEYILTHHTVFVYPRRTATVGVGTICCSRPLLNGGTAF